MLACCVEVAQSRLLAEHQGAMSASKPDLQARLEALRSRLKGADAQGGAASGIVSSSASNALLRELSCEAELLRMDLVDLAGGEKAVFKKEVADADLEKMLSDVGQLTQPTTRSTSSPDG